MNLMSKSEQMFSSFFFFLGDIVTRWKMWMESFHTHTISIYLSMKMYIFVMPTWALWCLCCRLGCVCLCHHTLSKALIWKSTQGLLVGIHSKD